MNTAKIAIILIAFIGLVMALFANLGWFVDSEKEAFVKIISQKGECSPDLPGARKFLKDYFYPLIMDKNEENIPIDKIVFVGTFTKSTANGVTIKEPHSGVIKVRNKNGEVTKDLVNYSEIINWPKKNQWIKWTSWTLLAISIFFQALIFLWEFIDNRRHFT